MAETTKTFQEEGVQVDMRYKATMQNKARRLRNGHGIALFYIEVTHQSPSLCCSLLHRAVVFDLVPLFFVIFLECVFVLCASPTRRRRAS